MATYQYIDKSELKTWLGLSGTGQDNNLDFAIDAATQAIDKYCGRSFTVEKSGDTYQTQTRYYDCEFADYVFVDDIATTDSLVVKTLNADGTDDQTLVLNTDFYLYPLNADKQIEPVMPFDKIVRAIENGGKVLPTHYPKGLKITE